MSAGGDTSLTHGDANIGSTLVWAYPICLPSANDGDSTKVLQFGPALAGPMNLIPVARVDAPGLLSSSWGRDSVSFDAHNSIYELGTALLPRAEERPDSKETRPQAPAPTDHVLDMRSDDSDVEELSIFKSSPNSTSSSRQEGCSEQEISPHAASSKFEQLLTAARNELSVINSSPGVTRNKYREVKTKKPVKRVTFAKPLTKPRKRAPKAAAVETPKAAAIEAPKAAAIEAPKPAVTVTPKAPNPIRKVAKRGRPRKLPHGVAIGCWTCRLRRKSCDMLHPECDNCLRLGVPCYGFDAVPPSFMDSAQTKEAMRKKVTAIGRANRERNVNEGTT